MMDDQKRKALRRAIEVFGAWHERVPLAYNGTLPEDIEVLQHMLIDVRQLPLPLARADAKLSDMMPAKGLWK